MTNEEVFFMEEYQKENYRRCERCGKEIRELFLTDDDEALCRECAEEEVDRQLNEAFNIYEKIEILQEAGFIGIRRCF